MSREDRYDLNRFVKVQNSNSLGNYEQILTCIKAGRKIEKGLWHIFPQYIDLDGSRQSQFFGITEYEEAVHYLAHPILGNRLRKVSEALLSNNDKSIQMLFNKEEIERILSCMTLFDKLSPDDIFAEVLNMFFNNKRCVKTLDYIETDTQALSFELLAETTDLVEIDSIMNEGFPEYGNMIVNQLDYICLKEDNVRFKALICRANTLNGDLLSTVKKILDKNVGNTDKTILLASVIRGEQGVRCIAKRCMELNALLRSYNGNDRYYSPYWSVSSSKTGLNFTFIIAYLK